MSKVSSGNFGDLHVYINSENGEIEVADITGEYGAVELPQDLTQLRALGELIIAAVDEAESSL